MINSFQGSYRFLSNFWPSVVVLAGAPYPSVEHAYQAAKSNDPDFRRRVSACSTPGHAKSLGRRAALRADWESVKVATMRALVRQKFEAGSDLAAQLIATGDSELVEGNTWGDTFWGVCRGVGENWLGRILMDVRRDLVCRNGGAWV
ncbi:MAG: NADAR family protein [Kofleriaceae bacterium]